MPITAFPTGTTKIFSFTITLNGVTPNISADIVTLTIKKEIDDTDAEAVLKKDADVITAGADGKAIFTLTSTETKELLPLRYHYDVVWYIAGGAQHILQSDQLNVLERVSDP